MRKKSKSAAILAVVMAMTLAGSSAVYAEENSSAKTAETDDNEKYGVNKTDLSYH